jgi:hypothetical protein
MAAATSGGEGVRRSGTVPLHWLEFPVGAVFLGLVGVLAIMPIASEDFFWHLTLGRVILREHRIPHTDLFSAVHPDAPYVQPQWLWELCAAWVDSLGGLRAIRVMQGMLLVASFALLLSVLRRLVRDRIMAWTIASLALLLFMDRFRARPDSLTLGFVAASLPLIVEPHAGDQRVRRIYAFVLALLWANVHGGASLLLFLSMGALVVGSFLHTRFGGAPRERFRDVCWLALSTVAGLLLSPTLIPGLIHWFALIGAQIDTGNEEWQPPYSILTGAPSPAAWLIALSPTVVLVFYVIEQVRLMRHGARMAERAGEWFLCGGYLALSHQAIRNVSLAILPLVFMARRALGAPRSLSTSLGAVLAACVCVAAVVQDAFVDGYGGFARARTLLHEDVLPDTYPVEAAQFIHEAGIEGGLFNEGKWGGYLIYRDWPDVRVFVDTRQNLTPEMWRVFLASLSAQERERALDYAFKRWGVELALFRAPTFPLLKPPPQYRLLFRAGDQELYQRVDGKHAELNLARARRELRELGPVRVDEPEEVAAARVGAELWLAQPEQVRVLSQAYAEKQSSDPRVRGRGAARLGELYYRAGLYYQAGEAFESEPLALRSTKHLYFAALSWFGAQHRERARLLVSALEQRDLSELSRRQLERLTMLRAALAQER